VLLAESPPAPGKKGQCRYFYDVNTRTGDSLFKETMAALDIEYGKDKTEGGGRPIMV
jgi:hypothetical protein